MITYTLDISGMEKRTSDGAIIKVCWTKTGTNEYGVSGLYASTIVYEQIDSGSFIPFEDLTEQVVKEWVTADIEYDSCNPTIAQKITENSNPIVILGTGRFPWN